MDLNAISAKWQKKWEEKEIFKVQEGKGKKFYCLEMYPYPSASFLHMGHVRNYTIGDVYARFKRMQGYNVLYPMGYDSFGLPAETAAKKEGIHPKEYAEKAIAKIKEYQKSLGNSYDWSRQIASHDPAYYKWNQYFFTKFLEKGLVYRKKAPVNWCDTCQSVLADEEAEAGKCWRCGSEISKKELEQWFFRITAYADKLLEDLKKIEWPEKIKLMQENWIGRSEGVEEYWQVDGKDLKLATFTTWPHTTYGATFMVIAPEHPLISELVKGTEYEKGALEFVKKARQQKLIDRINVDKEKEGFFTGRYVINHLTGWKMPLYIANFAIMEYGTGIVKCCPAHDQRDFEFAKKYNLKLQVVIQPKDKPLKAGEMTEAYVSDGVMVNAGKFTGMDQNEANKAVADHIVKQGNGKFVVQYKIRDWMISRQRYWGTPIPVVHCDKCGAVPVPEKDLPVLLPEKVDFKSGNPLAKSPEFVNTKCPKCGGAAKRDTDTMGGFMDSSWYFLRYCDPDNKKEAFSKSKVKYWMPVDQYIGGAEHAVMHLLYARFFVKALKDMGYVDFDEPFTRLFNQGIVYKDGSKMSKSKGNVVYQTDISDKYGIDTARFFLMFVSSPDNLFEWSDSGIEGAYRSIKKVLALSEKASSDRADSLTISKMHRCIKEVTEGIESFRYNNALVSLMEFVNFLSEKEKAPKEATKNTLLLLSPFTPHICEELWYNSGEKGFISLQKWPKHEESKIDKKAEAGEAIAGLVRKDIRAVIELTKISKPEMITLIVSPEWKYGLFKKIKSLFEKTHNMSEIVKECIDGKHNKEIPQIIGRALKDQSSVPSIILTQKEEIGFIREYLAELEAEFNSKIEIVTAESSADKKASQARPGKPAIIIK
ncbi:leucine--tRNA ligase [Candidatus Woesearchaeota archaeon]|nr:leucine--tRNA ligase [Candidatus Woesearchaeota archaeon]